VARAATGELPCSQWPRAGKETEGRMPACVARATPDGQIASARGDGDDRQEVGTHSKGGEGRIAAHAMAMRGNGNDGRITSMRNRQIIGTHGKSNVGLVCAGSETTGKLSRSRWPRAAKAMVDRLPACAARAMSGKLPARAASVRTVKLPASARTGELEAAATVAETAAVEVKGRRVEVIGMDGDDKDSGGCWGRRQCFVDFF
jgi:hypothetical protein